MTRKIDSVYNVPREVVLAMIDPIALYNEVLSGILDRIPAAEAILRNSRRDLDASDSARSVADEDYSNPSSVVGSNTVPFSALFDYFAQGGNINPLLREAIETEIDSAALRNNLDPNLVRAVIRAESSYRHDTVSHAGAMGLMQLMPATAASLGVVNPFDIRQNIDGGTRHLRRMLDMFDGNLELALAAYNAGHNAVRYHGGIPPFEETRNYVPRVLSFMEEYALRQYRLSAEDSR